MWNSASMKNTKEGFLPYFIKILFSSKTFPWNELILLRAELSETLHLEAVEAKKANWSNQRNLFVVHTDHHSNKTSMWTIYKKHDYECSRMQLDFDKKKKCWCIYRSLELENIFSQISTNSSPPCCPLPVLVYPPWDMCVCSYRCYKLGPGLWKMAAPEVRALPTCSMELFFSSIFFVPLLPKASLSSSGVWLQINLFSGKRRSSSHAMLCQHATHRP